MGTSTSNFSQEEANVCKFSVNAKSCVVMNQRVVFQKINGKTLIPQVKRNRFPHESDSLHESIPPV
jgi:hypothetical protein